MSQKKAYVPPSLRKKASFNKTQDVIPSHKRTKNSEPIKEFSLTDLFPTLGETIQKNTSTSTSTSTSTTTTSTSTTTTSTTTTSTSTNKFSNIASKKNTTIIAAANDPSKKENDTSALLPGWVYIRKNKQNHQIEYKYVEPPTHYISEKLQQIEKENQQLGNVLFKYRIERQQYLRDIDIERLGDLSEFYGLPTLDEMYENDPELLMNDDILNYSDNE